MASRAAKFISAIFASVIAGAPVATMSQSAPPASDEESAPAAANDCLSAPKGVAPQGQHWYYRLERGTKRQCWYLRERGEKASQATATSAAAPAKPAAQRADAPPSRSPQDARAEVPVPRTPFDQDTTGSITFAPAAPPAAPAPRADTSNGDTEQPGAASRLADADADNIAVSAPSAPPVASARQKQQSAPAPGTVTLATTNLPAEKPTGSIQTLLLVVLGALGLAGLSGSFIYRFAGSRAPVRHRRVNWQAAADSSRAPWAGEAPGSTPRSQSATHFKPVPAPETAPAFDLGPAPKPDRAVDAQDAESMDIEEITMLLEHLLQEGPKLDRPNAAAGSAGRAQRQQYRSDVRA